MSEAVLDEQEWLDRLGRADAYLDTLPPVCAHSTAIDVRVLNMATATLPARLSSSRVAASVYLRGGREGGEVAPCSMCGQLSGGGRGKGGRQCVARAVDEWVEYYYSCLTSPPPSLPRTHARRGEGGGTWEEEVDEMGRSYGRLARIGVELLALDEWRGRGMPHIVIAPSPSSVMLEG
uniref:Uncharacterized protein n=1 Tax=Palpitomonas bilix TaxID=652834 RepID=A0A7S3G3Z0_9EUKA